MTLARIIAIAVLAHMAFVSARMTGSLYALANKASTFTVGVMMALFALVPMLIAVRAGRWLDAVGPWRPTVTGVLLMLGGMLLPAAFPYATADVAPLLVAAALVGTGSTLVMLSVQQVVGERADPNHRAAAFSWLALGASISGFIGPVASGLLIDHFGHRATFAVLVGVVLAALALVWVNRALLPARDGTATGPEPLHPFELLKHTELRHVLIASALISMSWDLQTFVVPVHGTRVGLSASQIGFVLGSFAVATFTIRLAMPWLSRHFTEWQVLTYTLFTATVAFVLFPFFSSLAPLMAGRLPARARTRRRAAQRDVAAALALAGGPRRRGARSAHDDHEQQPRRAAAGVRRVRLGARRRGDVLGDGRARRRRRQRRAAMAEAQAMSAALRQRRWPRYQLG